MKVAIITNYWINSNGGGIKTYLFNFVGQLEKKGIDVNIIFKEGVDPLNYLLDGNRYLYPIKAFFILRVIKPDIINSQGTWYTLLAGYMYKKIYNVRLIHTFRSEPHKKLPYFIKTILQILLNDCDCVTFVSKGLENAIRDVYGLKFKRSTITYPGVKVKAVSEEEINNFRQKFNIKSDSIVLLVQAFVADKLKAEGTKYVIDAVKKLKNKCPNIILILTRHGKYSNELKQYAKKLGVMDNVVFTGDIDNPFVPLAICDIFLFPWLGKSGISNALLEAMCMGKSIIATSVNQEGVSEVIDDEKNGILVEPNIDMIVNKIEYLLQNPEFAERLGENAKKRVEEEYTWIKITEKFLRIYSDDLEENNTNTL